MAVTVVVDLSVVVLGMGRRMTMRRRSARRSDRARASVDHAEGEAVVPKARENVVRGGGVRGVRRGRHTECPNAGRLRLKLGSDRLRWSWGRRSMSLLGGGIVAGRTKMVCGNVGEENGHGLKRAVTVLPVAHVCECRRRGGLGIGAKDLGDEVKVVLVQRLLG